jgi:hypothetical protein
MIRDRKYKHVQFRDAPELLFNLDEDPAEHHNLVADDGLSSEDNEALTKLREMVDETLDWDEMVEERARDKTMAGKKYPLKVPSGSYVISNAYQLSNGDVISADSLMSSPEKLITKPELMYDDYPRIDSSD